MNSSKLSALPPGIHLSNTTGRPLQDSGNMNIPSESPRAQHPRGWSTLSPSSPGTLQFHQVRIGKNNSLVRNWLWYKKRFLSSWEIYSQHSCNHLLRKRQLKHNRQLGYLPGDGRPHKYPFKVGNMNTRTWKRRLVWCKANKKSNNTMKQCTKMTIEYKMICRTLWLN